MLKRREAVGTCGHVTGIEPTNNAAERALRAGVQRRKISFGTPSEAGSRFVERYDDGEATLKQHKRHVVAYLPVAKPRPLSCRPARWNRKRRRDSRFHNLNAYVSFDGSFEYDLP
jgi:transposase